MESETKGLSLDSFPAVPGSYPCLGELSVSSVVVKAEIAVWSGGVEKESQRWVLGLRTPKKLTRLSLLMLKMNEKGDTI